MMTANPKIQLRICEAKDALHRANRTAIRPGLAGSKQVQPNGGAEVLLVHRVILSHWRVNPSPCDQFFIFMTANCRAGNPCIYRRANGLAQQVDVRCSREKYGPLPVYPSKSDHIRPSRFFFRVHPWAGMIRISANIWNTKRS